MPHDADFESRCVFSGLVETVGKYVVGDPCVVCVVEVDDGAVVPVPPL